MRFDDSLRTVLAADASTAFGAASAWRQLVDLIGRGRAPATPEALTRLRELRGAVPTAVRASSARALAFAAPGPELVALFAEEELAIAAPVLRVAALAPGEWLALLPRLSPGARSVLRHRRDLPAEATRALESFGPVDFVLPYEGSEAPALPVVDPSPLAPADAPATPPVGAGPFVALGDVARGLPLVAEALRQAGQAAEPPPPPAANDRFEISDLVARIEAFNRRREEHPAPPETAPRRSGEVFAYQTDDSGAIRWVDGVARAAVIGVSLAFAGTEGAVDGVAAGAFRGRASFADARLSVAGTSPAAGDWRISGEPMFDPGSGRFAGYRGTARRPRADESAAPSRSRSPAADSLRQLVHELRTPANAIAGFAELIESELLGPAPTPYRERAGAIRGHAADLLAAIEDLDTAARIEGRALELRPSTVPLRPLLDRITADLRPLAELRGAALALAPVAADLALAVDDRAAERLFGRWLAALVASAGTGERLHLVALPEPDGHILVVVDRPASLAALPGEALLSIDAEQEAERPGAPLLGAGFALRLAQNLAGELGGALTIEPDRLTLRLPAADTGQMGQASFR